MRPGVTWLTAPLARPPPTWRAWPRRWRGRRIPSSPPATGRTPRAPGRRARLTPARREAAGRRREHLAELKTLHRFFAEPEQRSDDMPLRPQRVITELGRRLDERAVVTMDAGANRLYMTHYFQSRGAGTV